jgi:hypothetical protein
MMYFANLKKFCLQICGFAELICWPPTFAESQDGRPSCAMAFGVGGSDTVNTGSNILREERSAAVAVSG